MRPQLSAWEVELREPTGGKMGLEHDRSRQELKEDKKSGGEVGG